MGFARIQQQRESEIQILLWFCYPIVYPFYFFSSGLPQPSDWILGILIAIGLLNAWVIRISFFNFAKDILKYFVWYVVIVNTLWFFFIDQSDEKPFPSIFHSLFYVYNFFVFRLAIILYQRFKKKFIIYTAYGVGASMIIQALWAYLSNAAISRTPLFFNNPNQLGYYALLSGTLLVIVASKFPVNFWFQIVSYFSFFFLSLISASKAALAGSMILVLLAFFNQGLLSFKQLIVILMVFGAGYYFITMGELGRELYDYSSQRFEAIGQTADDSAEGRGYDRIFNNPEYVIFGAGEGGYYRFDTAIKAHEIHSSFGTILFCYGLIGFYLFVIFLIRIFRKGMVFNFLYMIPVFVYSITHQGLRSTLFWILLALIYVINFEHKIQKETSTSRQVLAKTHRLKKKLLYRKQRSEI